MGLKQLGYYFFKYWVSLGLFFYYRSIKLVGVENIPKDTPVLFLSNHQNALMDILLIAVHSQRKPWYLTRADVFKSKIFRPLFEFLQMIPIYRMRDGKANIAKNQLIFEKCGHLLDHREAILLFPEANQSLKRRVRPLSKGFTRIIDAALQRNPFLEVKLVPIGQNYQFPRQAGDRVALYFGKPIAIQEFVHTTDFAGRIKQKVFEELKELTTHIEEDDYDTILYALEDVKADFTQPKTINTLVKENSFGKIQKKAKKGRFTLTKFLFHAVNLPFIFLWRILLKPKIPEPEFETTYRFGFALLAYPIAYFITLMVIGYYYNIQTACLWVIGHAVSNLFLVKYGITSYDQIE